jgi:predicted amidohydrolase
MSEILVAGIQMDVTFGELAVNLARMLAALEQACAQGARLVVFPECALSGYMFDSLETACRAAEPIPGPAIQVVSDACRRLDLYAVFGMLEIERQSGQPALYNSAALCGPEGFIGAYRKTHLPYLGVDRFTRPGDGPYRAFETEIGRLGLLICYDLRFPEPARCLALLGADLLILPTNWPEGADTSPDFTAPARAVENRVFVVAVNRAGAEGGVPFIGKSQIVEPSGKRLTTAPTADQTIITAKLDPAVARQKRLVFKPGVFEIDTVGDRRPELYGALTEQDDQLTS